MRLLSEKWPDGTLCFWVYAALVTIGTGGFLAVLAWCMCRTFSP